MLANRVSYFARRRAGIAPSRNDVPWAPRSPTRLSSPCSASHRPLKRRETEPLPNPWHPQELAHAGFRRSAELRCWAGHSAGTGHFCGSSVYDCVRARNDRAGWRSSPILTGRDDRAIASVNRSIASVNSLECRFALDPRSMSRVRRLSAVFSGAAPRFAGRCQAERPTAAEALSGRR